MNTILRESFAIGNMLSRHGGTASSITSVVPQRRDAGQSPAGHSMCGVCTRRSTHYPLLQALLSALPLPVLHDPPLAVQRNKL